MICKDKPIKSLLFAIPFPFTEAHYGLALKKLHMRKINLDLHTDPTSYLGPVDLSPAFGSGAVRPDISATFTTKDIGELLELSSSTYLMTARRIIGGGRGLYKPTE